MTRKIAIGSALMTVTMLAGCSMREQSMGRGRELSDREMPDARNVKDVTPPRILPETFLAAGTLHEQQGVVNKAIDQYRKSIAAKADFAPAHHRLGVLLSKTGRHDEAMASLLRAAELAPQAAGVHNDLGFEYAIAKRWDDAERELNLAIDLQPGFARAYVNLGMVLCQQERYAEALNTFSTVLPEPDAHYNMGVLFRGQQRYKDAQIAFEHVLALNPEFAAAIQQLEQIEPNVQRGEGPGPLSGLHSSSATLAAIPPTPAVLHQPEAVAIPLEDTPQAEPAIEPEPATKTPLTEPAKQAPLNPAPEPAPVLRMKEMKVAQTTPPPAKQVQADKELSPKAAGKKAPVAPAPPESIVAPQPRPSDNATAGPVRKMVPVVEAAAVSEPDDAS